MKKETNDLIEDDDYSIEDIEKSIDDSNSFIYEELLPQVDDFESSIQDTSYVPGTVTHCLFVELIQRMYELGYTYDDLKKELETYTDFSLGQMLH